MITTHNVYIALGSNKGDRLKHLQDAVDLIFEKLGRIEAIAKVYNTPALGFQGDDFFNSCLLLQTEYDAQTVINMLLEIEKRLGRERSSASGYVSRTIDLDVLFFNDEHIESEALIVPHPRLHERNFVLQPMLDIAAKFTHPKFNKTIMQLMVESPDDSVLEPANVWLKNPIKKYELSKLNYIAIEGNIGAGKTSLATKIANEFNAKLILERFADNPFLPKFYEDQQRYAFTLEMSFLADRYQQISDDLSQLDLFRDFIVSDYDIYKSLIFSKITLPEDEFRLYRKLFYLMYKDIAKPELYIYLYQNTERLQENIRKRGRDYEKNIENAYLEKINAGYLEFLKNQSELNVKMIDISDKDFVKHREDYLWLLGEISSGKLS